MTQEADIVIVGAGPIGLAHACGFQKLNPNLKIVILDQYQTYQRNHVLNMKSRPLEELVKNIDATNDEILSALRAQLKVNPYIRTSKLQETFKSALKHDTDPNTVNFVYQKVGYEVLLADKPLKADGTLDRDKIVLDKIYLFQDNSFAYLKPDGLIEEGALAPLNIDTSNLTNKIKEPAFKKRVIEALIKQNGLKTEAQRVKETLLEYNPKLIIGADGSHSIISKTFFPEGNQEKIEFGYTLQMRYEIQGELKPNRISSSIPFYQEMSEKGLIGSEHIGTLENGKTPITLTMVISKKAYDALKDATSKEPIRPFGEAPVSPKGVSLDHMPDKLRDFLLRYWTHRLNALENQTTPYQIDAKSITISVNETPATHAKQVLAFEGDTAILLVGDAGLGLSFFKGLNAGIEATAHLMKLLASKLQNWGNQKTMHKAFSDYQNWMLTVFGPKKYREMKQYKALNIDLPQTSFDVLSLSKAISKPEHSVEMPALIKDYFDLRAAEPTAKVARYPHRAYPLVTANQLENIPVQHSFIKIKKLFIDYTKPYKSYAQILQDFRQPLSGFSNFLIGLFNIAKGLFGFNAQKIKEGCAILLRSLAELLTAPLAWTLKPLIRGALTLAHGGFAKVEENESTQVLVKRGLEKLDTLSSDKITPTVKHELLSLSTDLDRKFQRAVKTGQPSLQMPLSEKANYNRMRESINNPDKQKLMTELKRYFESFQIKPQNTEKPGVDSKSTIAKP